MSWELEEEGEFFEMVSDEESPTTSCTPLELRLSVNIARSAVIPEKSKKRY